MALKEAGTCKDPLNCQVVYIQVWLRELSVGVSYMYVNSCTLGLVSPAPLLATYMYTSSTAMSSNRVTESTYV